MARHRITAVLLVVSIGLLAPACVSGWLEQGGCERKPTAARLTKDCTPGERLLEGRRGACGLRSFLQLDCPQPPSGELGIPHLLPSTTLPLAVVNGIEMSSVGSPETDRGPPSV